jgi:hypothetical protein
MKKGKMSDSELACLKGMLSEDVSTEDMAKQLDRSVSAIEKELNKIAEEREREQLFINKTESGNEGVSIMTPHASMKIDDARRDRISKPQRNDCIHKIYNNK